MGGSLENRTRFSRRIVEGIRRECGPDFVIGLAVSTSDAYDVLLSTESLCEIVALHDATGDIDYVTCGHGGYMDFERLMPTFLCRKADSAGDGELKKAVKHAAVTSEAHVRRPRTPRRSCVKGGRSCVHRARPDRRPASGAQGDGRAAEDVRGCISCNQMCWGRRSRDYWISCLINPSAGANGVGRRTASRPRLRRRTCWSSARGPAGCEAARVAAERGHRVRLAEALPVIGGQFRLAGEQPRRAQILDLFGWYERQFNKLGVAVSLNSFVDPDALADDPAETVILATGSLPTPTRGSAGCRRQRSCRGCTMAASGRRKR